MHVYTFSWKNNRNDCSVHVNTLYLMDSCQLNSVKTFVTKFSSYRSVLSGNICCMVSSLMGKGIICRLINKTWITEKLNESEWKCLKY